MTYETREQYLNAFIEAAREQFNAVGAPLPLNVRVSVGFTSKGSRGKRIGECWSSDASADGHFEIFISPQIENVAHVCDVLTHELVHAALGIAEGHGKKFGRVARALGLEGPLTATQAGKGWYDWALPIIETLGDMPYAQIDGGTRTGRPKQKTSLLKVECPCCGFVARVTSKHITPHAHLNCPVPECVGVLMVEGGEQDEQDGE